MHLTNPQTKQAYLRLRVAVDALGMFLPVVLLRKYSDEKY